jgi:YggT family protein
LIITARVLLSWFPQAQGVAALQPVYAITDPYLNLFRGIIPPIFGLDLSPLLAFFLLNVMTNVTAAVGAEIPPGGVPRNLNVWMSQNRRQQPSLLSKTNWSAKVLQRQQEHQLQQEGVSLDL